jgi:hypothetical protein
VRRADREHGDERGQLDHGTPVTVAPAQDLAGRALVLRIEPPGHRCPVVSTHPGADR